MGESINMCSNNGWYSWMDAWWLYIDVLKVDKKAFRYLLNNPNLIGNASIHKRGISGGFVWKDTPQGHTYWEEINKKLKHRGND